MRALAALAVLEGHVFGVSRGFGAAAWNSFWARTLLGGGVGVFLFFALTGYLLFRPFVRRDLGAGNPVQIGRYAANRAFRILPLYYVVLVVYILWIDRGGTATVWWQSLLFLENFFPNTLNHVDGVMWSLVVEVQFYVVLPLLAVVLARLSRGSAMAMAGLLVGGGVVAEIVRILVVSSVHVPDVRWKYSLPGTFVFFVPGMLLAVVESRWDRIGPYLRGVTGKSTLWFAASIPLWLLDSWRVNLDVAVLAASFLVVGSVALPLDGGVVRRVLEWRPLAMLGVASYSLYLWHFPIVLQVAGSSWAPHGYAALMAVCVPLSCVVALASYRLVEAPFLRLRRAWSAAAASRDLEPGYVRARLRPAPDTP